MVQNRGTFLFFPTKHAKQELFLPRKSMALWGVGVAGLGKLYFHLFLLIMRLAAQADFWIAGRKSWLNFSSFEFSYAEALGDDYTNLLNPNSFLFLLATASLCALVHTVLIHGRSVPLYRSFNIALCYED